MIVYQLKKKKKDQRTPPKNGASISIIFKNYISIPDSLICILMVKVCTYFQDKNITEFPH